MAGEIDILPDDPALLKEKLQEQMERLHLIEEKHKAEYQSLKEKYRALEAQHRLLDEKHRTLVRKFFGKRNEKLTAEDELQGRLFNEAEDGNVNADDGKPKEKTSPTAVRAYTRKKPGRKPLPDDIPREETIYDVPNNEKKCPCCGKDRPLIGTEESEELDIVPAKVYVIRNVKRKYGPCGCDEFIHSGKPEVITAKMPERMIPGSIASAGLLAYAMTSKFADALPFYRQSDIFKRIGVDISRATMCNWAISAWERMGDLFEVFIDEMKKGEFMRMDETTVQVLHEEGRSPESKSYMWVAVGYPARGKPLVLFQYHPSRSREIPNAFLDGFKGYLQTDGYDGYNLAASRDGIMHIGCFAHARRYFYDAAQLNQRDSLAHKALEYIRALYEIESRLREQNLPLNAFIETRKKEASPLLDEFHAWLVRMQPEVVPSVKTGQAIAYTLKEWSKFVRYLDADYLTPDNNEIERTIRPFVIGRKNWLFSNTPRGAHASAAMYSLIESAKVNNVEPYRYLRFLFTKLPHSASKDALRVLLPCYVTEKQLASV